MDPLTPRQELLDAQLREAGRAETLAHLVGGIAHHFNNLLGAMQGFAGLLTEDLADKPEQRRFAEKILVGCEQGRDVLRQLGIIVQPENTDKRIVDLAGIAREAANLISASLPKSVRLQFHYAGGPLPALVSPALLAQLMVLLCLRAGQALGGRAGTVSVSVDRAHAGELDHLIGGASSRHARIIGATGSAGEYARLRVADSAPPILDHALSELFEAGASAERRQGDIALAFVRHVIESHGGACHVASRPGEGTVFSIYLPLRKAAGEMRAGRSGVRILIVDDERDIVDRLSLGLEKLGYETVGVTDPVEALAAFEEDPGAWDIVIADEAMPQMSGLELARKLKTARSDIRIVFCDGRAGGTDNVLMRAAGVDAVLRKPTDVPAIAARLRQLVSARAAV